MSNVGLSFGSPTSGAGFDVASTVTAILATQSGVETAWKTQLSTLEAQNTAFTSLGTDLSSLSTALSSLTAFDGLFASKQGSSSNTDVLSLSSASTTAVAGSHTVTVTSLAQTSSNYSARVAATDTLSGSLTIQVGSGTAQTITLDSSDDTLATLASAINTGSYGVNASVITDTQGSRLSLVSSTSGAAGQLTLTPSLTDSTTSTTVGFTSGQTGVDAVLTVDGLATTSASNTVTGVIPGVTFQILAAAPSSPVQVQITNDNSDIETAAQTFVTAYNKVVADIKTQEGKDSSGNAEPLYGDPTLALIQTALSNALSAGTSSGTISSMDQIGLTVNQDGTLTLDASTMDTALNSHFNDVASFFQATGSWGEDFTTTLNQIGSTNTTGALALAESQISTVETSLNTDVSNEDALLATEQTSLTTELNTANEVLQSIPAQLNEQNILYSSLTGYVASTL